MRLTLFFFSVVASAQLAVLPLPNYLISTPGCLLLSPSLSFIPTGAGGNDATLSAALSRARRTIATIGTRGESVQPCTPEADSTISSLTVSVGSALASPYPALGDDESYALHVSAGGASMLSAPTVWGALRGLETLTQLVSADRAPDSASPRLVIPAAWVNASDSPRFSHRGLMIDTGRAFLPVPLILATLDAMSYVKLNVLHWHISDDQAFPAQSTTYPNLVAGAMQAPSLTHTYSKADMTTVVEAAAARGIRVVAEFDIPGHTKSWFVGYPFLRSNCTTAGGFGAPMDPTLDSTYTFIAGLLTEMQAAFPDNFFHIGGDEVDFTCWQNTPHIVAFMQAKGLTPPELQLYFENRVVDMFQGEKQLLIWEGNAGANNSYPTAENVVVNVWKEEMGDFSVMDPLVKSGKKIVFTTRNWYLDWTYQGNDRLVCGCVLFVVHACTFPSSLLISPPPPTPPVLFLLLPHSFDDHVNGPSQWQYYHTDVFSGSSLTPELFKLVLGAEVCMWSPYTDSTSFFSTVFPRAAAVAERLWSAPGPAVDEGSSLAQRMHAARCRMVARGIAAAPVVLSDWSGNDCPNPFSPPYNPPWAQV
jgi:hexosaminidase